MQEKGKEKQRHMCRGKRCRDTRCRDAEVVALAPFIRKGGGD